MPQPTPAYVPRSPGDSVVYQIVRGHFETFRVAAAAAHEGDGLPRFVEHAFRRFLACGWLAGGFARFRCGACGHDRLVPFSCKGRALCPSCGGRRMTERAAHLVDHVLPDVPVRQWVLTVPGRVRYQMAWNHPLCRAVSGILVRAIDRQLRARACDEGVDGGRSGAVVVVQRFGSALNLNVHLHALVLDGVFAPGDDGALAFHRLPALSALDVADVLATVVPLVTRRLERLGLGTDEATVGEDAWSEEAPLLAGLAAASVAGMSALGERGGQRTRRVGGTAPEVTPADETTCQARQDGFDLHAGLVIGAGQRERLERVCRYVLRPPVAEDRLALTADGDVQWSLRRPWRDGTTSIVFSPQELLERLAVLVPKPQVNLLAYFGVLGARSAWRREVTSRFVPAAGDSEGMGSPDESAAQAPKAPTGRGLRWAALMQRAFGFDALACPRCGGRLRLIALIEQTAVVERILRHLGLPTEIPAPRQARAPPDDDWRLAS